MSQPDERAHRRLASALHLEWTELGGAGRIAFLGILLSLGVAVVLGFAIPAATSRHIRHAHLETLQASVAHLEVTGLLPTEPTRPGDNPTLDEVTDLRLMGGDVVGFRVWNGDGEVIYSDRTDEVGQRRTITPEVAGALAGDPDIAVVNREGERYLTYYVPAGALAVEVFEDPHSAEHAVSMVRRNVWSSIGLGLGVLGIFMGSLTLANARVLNRRRRQAEDLFDALVRSQEEERHRIVGALHDDIGQPLYRLLYGLQGSRDRIDADHAVSEELERLEQIVREIDSRLRAELRVLHSGLTDGLGLVTALEDLADITHTETDLEVAIGAVDDRILHDLGADEASTLLRSAHEALMNVRKHAHATRVEMSLSRSNGTVTLHVDDDGAGMSGSAGLGLATSRQRLEMLDGSLTLGKSPLGGTRFTARVPATPQTPARPGLPIP